MHIRMGIHSELQILHADLQILQLRFFYYFIILRSQTSGPMPAGESVFA